MLRDNLLIALRALAGMLIGITAWWVLAEPYSAFLARVAEPLLRLGEEPAITRLHAAGNVIAVERSDFATGSVRPGVAIPPLTVNIVLLTALFAANRRSLTRENLFGVAFAVMLCVPLHVFAVVANVHSIYALKLGAWSERNYNLIERNAWAGAAHFYIFVGGFAAAFVLWWLLRPGSGRGGVTAGAARA